MFRNVQAHWLLPLTLLAVPASALAEETRDQAEPIRLRVLSYNIRYGLGLDGELDLDRIATIIKSVDPDIVALQEVDRGVERSGRVDQAAEFARLTGMRAVFERNIVHQGGDYGNALLSRLPIVEHRNVHLPSFDDSEQRGVLVVDVSAPDGKTPIRILATHLDHRRDDRERLASVQVINEIASETPDRPALLLGDINATPESAVLEALNRSWRSANREPLFTIPAQEPNRQIDYILYRPEAAWKVVEVRVLDEPVASDHRPIFAVLELLD
ncbi:endonuclease/exonuclease/phosphatase family protein [soil metagenome]